VKVQSV